MNDKVKTAPAIVRLYPTIAGAVQIGKSLMY
jgi:hypothetical protein